MQPSEVSIVSLPCVSRCSLFDLSVTDSTPQALPREQVCAPRSVESSRKIL